MSIFCLRCRTKHPQRECPLNNIYVCHICTEEHPTDNFPSLLGLQAIYKSGDVAKTSRRIPWKPRDQPAYQNFPPQPPLYYPLYQPPQQWKRFKLAELATPVPSSSISTTKILVTRMERITISLVTTCPYT